MNLRELWDTVVLRDILGYIFPGCVTLLAVALLLTDCELLDVWDWLDVCRNQGILGLLRLPLDQPRLLLLIAPVAYVIGHLQYRIFEAVDKWVPSWRKGGLALDYLSSQRMGEDYATAALELFAHRTTARFACEPMMKSIGQHRDEVADCQRRAQCKLSENDAYAKEKKENRSQGERQAQEIWRLCDRYVLAKQRDLHAMFVGRYYVLALLFTNLGASLILLGVSVCIARFASDGATTAVAMVLLVALFIVLWIPRPQRHDCGPPWSAVAQRSAFGVGTIAAIALSLGSVGRATVLVPTASGALLIWQSGYFRKRFVECTFPIFYAIVRAEESSKPAQA